MNRGMIEENASEIVRVEGRVDANWDAIADNQMAINNNTMALDDHATRISANDMRIGQLSEDMDVLRAGVAAAIAMGSMPTPPADRDAVSAWRSVPLRARRPWRSV